MKEAIVDGISDDVASPPLEDDHHQCHDYHLNGTSMSTHGQDKDYSASISTKERIIGVCSGRDNFDFGSAADQELCNSNCNRESIQIPSAGVMNTGKLSEIAPVVPRERTVKDPVETLQKHKFSVFTAKDLNSSIIASESTRIFCSILIALLVVLSYVDCPLLGINLVNNKSVIAAKPLYMLLLTDITILVGHLILVRRRRTEPHDEDDTEVTERDGGLNWARAVRILERGLVAHQTIRAIFIDCSLYVVIVSCGLSLI